MLLWLLLIQTFLGYNNYLTQLPIICFKPYKTMLNMKEPYEIKRTYIQYVKT